MSLFPVLLKLLSTTVHGVMSRARCCPRDTHHMGNALQSCLLPPHHLNPTDLFGESFSHNRNQRSKGSFPRMGLHYKHTCWHGYKMNLRRSRLANKLIYHAGFMPKGQR